ncbi:molybdate ABC transporter substrate-binding protein [Microbacterium sp. ET2]|uniref:molybdate ABC transporter substrate-binding protein n=1 Tax=Microbacterium albipurpureum TaxID=3050384 RepID=UPI00259CCEBB|nr:molybdate ABC transporter substrate-binding protein [Microbacterium sp. ET2 (Ac-2212)]WJL96294.1 molybdate ABC transporter substrate-binding protein [Microbacterium sp. ET2 (Ac-2212)]
MTHAQLTGRATSRGTVRRATIGALAAAAAVLSGCAGTAAPTSPPSVADGGGLTGSLTVYAAASLQSAFDDLLTVFAEQNPDAAVQPLVTDGSSALATQIIEGAPADVFASADERVMQHAIVAGVAVDPVVFAANTLVLVTPAGNPAGIAGLADLDGATVVLCEPDVPCGAASRRLLDNAGVSVTPASLEQNVTAVVTKVAAGEADAGMVYATDVVGRDDVEVIVPDGAADVVNLYPIAVTTRAASDEAARAFIALVTGPEGQRVLADAGFASAP